MKSEPEAGAGRLNDPVKPPPKRVEDASKTELFDALKAMFAGEEPNLLMMQVGADAMRGAETVSHVLALAQRRAW